MWESGYEDVDMVMVEMGMKEMTWCGYPRAWNFIYNGYEGGNHGW